MLTTDNTVNHRRQSRRNTGGHKARTIEAIYYFPCLRLGLSVLLMSHSDCPTVAISWFLN